MSNLGKLIFVVLMAVFATVIIVIGTSASAQIVPATHAGNHWDEGEAVTVMLGCRTRGSIEAVALAYADAHEDGETMTRAYTAAGMCEQFFGWVRGIMVERFGRYHVYNGAIIEVWSVASANKLWYALFALPPGSSLERGTPTPLDGGRDAATPTPLEYAI